MACVKLERSICLARRVVDLALLAYRLEPRLLPGLHNSDDIEKVTGLYGSSDDYRNIVNSIAPEPLTGLDQNSHKRFL